MVDIAQTQTSVTKQQKRKNPLLQGLLWSRDKTLNTFYRTIFLLSATSARAHPPKGVSHDILWESLSLQYSATSSCSNSSGTRNLTKKKKKRFEAEERQKDFLKTFLFVGRVRIRFCKGKETVNKPKWARVLRKSQQLVYARVLVL